MKFSKGKVEVLNKGNEMEKIEDVSKEIIMEVEKFEFVRVDLEIGEYELEVLDRIVVFFVLLRVILFRVFFKVLDELIVRKNELLIESNMILVIVDMLVFVFKFFEL